MMFCVECGRKIKLDTGRYGNPWYHVNSDITDHEAQPE
jgi:hypothetical protein